MPPRFVYWTILIDGKPTAFRARDQQELLPTIGQLKRTNQDVVLKWFARGKLWDSPEAERAADPRPPFTGEKRGADWRPGGAHKDPRDRFKKKNRPERAWSDKESPTRRDRDKLGPPADRDRRPFVPRPSGGGRPWSGTPQGPRKPWGAKPDGPRKPWSGKPDGPRKPWSGKPDGPRKPWSGKPDGPRKPWSPKPDASRKPWSGKPDRPRKPWAAKPDGARKPWTPKPSGENPRDHDARRSAPPRRTNDSGWQRRAPGAKPRDDDPDKK